MSALTERLSDIVKRQLKGEYTSVSYAILQHGEVMAADSIGFKNRKDMEPADERCTYNVASISKIFCTTAVMQLAERGLVDLDTPVCTYLPRLSMPLDGRYKQITLRHCLSHSSGLPGTQWRGFSVSSTEGADYYADVYDFLSKSTLKADPGDYSVYCNDGFSLAEMVVAEVSGMPYADYCLEHITKPLGLQSSRLSTTLNPDYTVVSEGKKPAELLLIQGGAGYTTTMTDLVRFGNIFLTENAVLSEASKAEMAARQGKTFLKRDEKSPLFGLGWDNTQYRDPDYDLGEGVLLKGGNSFQFDTQFFVIPKYDAVLAISETHDCGLNINALIMRLFATMMLEQGVNIYTHYQPIPEEIIKRFSGTYLMPSCAFDLKMDGACADMVRIDVRKKGGCLWHDLLWNGKEFEFPPDRQEFLFDESPDNTFLMTRFRSYVTGCAMKAKDFPKAPEAWEKRVGKRYIPCTLDACDEVIYEDMSGLRIEKLPGFEGIFTLAFSGREGAGVYGFFESTVHAVDENRGIGFLRTPANPSRDLVDPIFYEKDGVEYCDAASYTYRDVEGIEAWSGQSFPEKPRNNGVYRIDEELKELPVIPEGHRVIVLDKDLVNICDSLFGEEFKPVKEGYIILI